MKINSNTKIYNDSVILVPYCVCHVEKYHRWMQSKDLQNLTASSPLTLQEEYDMQASWFKDEDKCTFIVLDRHTYDSSNDEIKAMIGDTNIFLKDRESGIAEIEIMIAEKDFRGRKRGWNAIVALMRYACENLQIKKYFAKVDAENYPSIELFKKLHFVSENSPDYFNEFSYEVTVSMHWLSWIKSQSSCYHTLHYME